MPRRLKKIKTKAPGGANVSVRRPVVDGVVDDAKVPIPNRFHRTVVHYPGCVMFVTGLVALILAGLAFGAGESELGGSFTDISNIKVQRLYGFFAFRQDYWKATDKDLWRRLSSDFGRTRSPSISRAALARIPVKPTTQSREKAAPPRRTGTDHGAPRREEDCRFSVVVRARKSGDILGQGFVDAAENPPAPHAHRRVR